MSYHGLEVLGGGAILSGLLFASIAVSIIDKPLKQASIYAQAGAVLSFFGFTHTHCRNTWAGIGLFD